jgi:hypothetical protein
MYGSAANFGGTPPFNAMPHGNPPLNNFAFNQQQQQQMLASSMPQAPHSQAPHSQAQPQPQSQQQQEKIPEPLGKNENQTICVV